MRLEVLADKRGAVIYVLNKPEISVGAGADNDVVISSPEVSKKHLKLFVTAPGKCSVMDMGSTNGTYLNDEKLIPGRREEFKLFTSLRLGDKVLLTLLDKDKGPLPELPLREQFLEEVNAPVSDHDKTQVISLKTLQKTKTEKVRKKRLKKLEKDLKKKKRVRDDRSRINQAVMSGMVILGLAYGAMKFFELSKKKKERTTIVGTIKTGQYRLDDELALIDESTSDLPTNVLSVEEISRHLFDVSCTLPEEIFFCRRLPQGIRRTNVAVKVDGKIIVSVEGEEWLARAQELVDAHSQLKENPDAKKGMEEGETQGRTSRELHRIAFLLLIKEHFSSSIPKNFLEDDLYFVFVASPDSAQPVSGAVALRGKSLPLVNTRFSEKIFTNRNQRPYEILRRLDRFLVGIE